MADWVRALDGARGGHFTAGRVAAEVTDPWGGPGEAYHRWHHQHPKAFQRPGLDLPYYLFILPLLKLGVFHGKTRL